MNLLQAGNNGPIIMVLFNAKWFLIIMIIVPFTTIWWNLKNTLLIKWLHEKEYQIICSYSQIVVICEIRSILRIENLVKPQNCNNNIVVVSQEKYQQLMQLWSGYCN